LSIYVPFGLEKDVHPASSPLAEWTNAFDVRLSTTVTERLMLPFRRLSTRVAEISLDVMKCQLGGFSLSVATSLNNLIERLVKRNAHVYERT